MKCVHLQIMSRHNSDWAQGAKIWNESSLNQKDKKPYFIKFCVTSASPDGPPYLYKAEKKNNLQFVHDQQCVSI